MSDETRFRALCHNEVEARERLRLYATGEIRQAVFMSRRFNNLDLGLPDDVARVILRRVLESLVTELLAGGEGSTDE